MLKQKQPSMDFLMLWWMISSLTPFGTLHSSFPSLLLDILLYCSYIVIIPSDLKKTVMLFWPDNLLHSYWLNEVDIVHFCFVCSEKYSNLTYLKHATTEGRLFSDLKWLDKAGVSTLSTVNCYERWIFRIYIFHWKNCKFKNWRNFSSLSTS